VTGAVARRELPSYEQIPQKLVSDCKLKTNDALAATCSTAPEDEIGALAYKSKEMDIPVIPEQIKVYSRWRSPNGGVSHRSRLHRPCRFACVPTGAELPCRYRE